tara:strand:- start:4132 stop:4347 length:216 start_codon:yes stop_codon:yes gene_type:complete
MSRFLVTRCICHDKSFEEIKGFAQENDITDVRELQALNYCSNSCRLCAPYVEMVLETGETEFTPGAYYGRK